MFWLDLQPTSSESVGIVINQDKKKGISSTNQDIMSIRLQIKFMNCYGETIEAKKKGQLAKAYQGKKIYHTLENVTFCSYGV